ncbi:MAG: HAMP domain-containing histidine kinase [Treponema sp.]|nr:HAMP domain-containing histidine kinase [Treponema sp.]
MTIKRRLFFSNIRMIFVTGATFSLSTYLVRMIYGGSLSGPGGFQELNHMDLRVTIPLLILVIFTIIFAGVNSFLTHRMTRRIIQPLEPLGEGVSQIHANNLSYRINYSSNDEFRPICDAFNEMAEKLEATSEQKERDEKNRRELIAGISHDLRTPLTSIKGYLEGLETGVASTAEMRREYFYTVKKKTSEMERIIEQLFLFSKLDMDEFPLHLKELPLNRIISDMIEELSPEYSKKGLAILYDDPKEEIPVKIDVIMFRNVLVNIIENSAKYKTRPQGTVELTLEVINGFVSINVKDDGPGVEKENLSKLFDVFYRADPSRSLTGSGLGLAICAKIITTMGGTIHGELPESGGLSIIINLPLVEKEA